MRAFLVTTFAFFAISAHAQNLSPQLLTSAGDYFKNSSFQLSWSLGETMTETFEDDFVLSQGFHQTDLLIIGIDEARSSFFSAYPNPTYDKLRINISNSEVLTFFLSDVQGRLLASGLVTASENEIALANFSSGIYFLTIQRKTLPAKTIKIIKK